MYRKKKSKEIKLTPSNQEFSESLLQVPKQ